MKKLYEDINRLSEQQVVANKLSKLGNVLKNVSKELLYGRVGGTIDLAAYSSDLNTGEEEDIKKIQAMGKKPLPKVETKESNCMNDSDKKKRGKSKYATLEQVIRNVLTRQVDEENNLPQGDKNDKERMDLEVVSRPSKSAKDKKTLESRYRNMEYQKKVIDE